MATSPQHLGSGRVVFGPFEFVAESLDLRKHGTRIRLRGQPVQILAKLLSRPGTTVTREELQVLLWKDTTFVDFEQGLNAAVNKLRQALGDSADQPRYIETVPGTGYRFIAPVHFAVGKPVAEMPLPREEEHPGESPAKPNGKRILLGVAAAIVALAALGAGIPAWLNWRNRPPEVTASAVRFQIPVPPELRLAGTETEADPPGFWSPDSRQIAFYAGEKLKVVGLDGGAPREICRVPGTVLGGAWNRDGQIVFGTETRGIMRVPAAGGEAVQVTTRDPARAERVHAWPSFLPDGKHFIYLRIASDPALSGLFVRATDAKPGDADVKKLLTTTLRAQFIEDKGDATGQGTLLFQRDEMLFAQKLNIKSLSLVGEASMIVPKIGRTRAYGFFDASVSGRLVHRDSPSETGRFYWFDRQGVKQTPVGEQHYLDASPVISPDGSHFAISRFDDRATEVWTHDLGRDVSQKITKDPSLDVAPIWSADGKTIYFSSGRAGTYDLYRVPAGGGAETLVLATQQNKFATSASPDGKFIAFDSRAAGGNTDIWVLPLEDDPKPQPLIRTPAAESSAKFSPDGKMLAWVSHESGVPEVYCARFPLAGGSELTGGPESKVVISRGGGTAPRWGRGGRELYYRSADGTLMAVDILNAGSLNAGSLKPGRPQPLFRLSGVRWDAAHDGSRFLVDEPLEKTVPPFVAVLDWAAEWHR